MDFGYGEKPGASSRARARLEAADRDAERRRKELGLDGQEKRYVQGDRGAAYNAEQSRQYREAEEEEAREYQIVEDAEARALEDMEGFGRGNRRDQPEDVKKRIREQREKMEAVKARRNDPNLSDAERQQADAEYAQLQRDGQSLAHDAGLSTHPAHDAQPAHRNPYKEENTRKRRW